MISTKKMPATLILLGFILIFLFGLTFNIKKDALRFIKFEPKITRVLKVGQPLIINYTYTLNSTSEAKVYARFLYKKKSIKPYRFPDKSDTIKPGRGSNSLKVVFTDVIKIDEIELYIIKIDSWSLIKRAWSSSFDNVTVRVPIKTDIKVIP